MTFASLSFIDFYFKIPLLHFLIYHYIDIIKIIIAKNSENFKLRDLQIQNYLNVI